MNTQHEKPSSHLPRLELAIAESALARNIDLFDTEPGGLPYVAYGNRSLLKPKPEVDQFDIHPEDN